MADITNYRTPDMLQAGKAFASIALVRAHGVKADLHQLEMAQAISILDAGGTEHEALSARWGGVVAIGANIDLFRAGIAAYEEAVVQTGTSPLGDDPKAKYWGGGMTYLSQVIAEAPDEYERFLRHIGM